MFSKSCPKCNHSSLNGKGCFSHWPNISLLIETMPQELSKITQSVHSKHKRKFDCFLNCKMQILLLIWPFKLVEGSQGVSLGPTIKVTTSKV